MCERTLTLAQITTKFIIVEVITSRRTLHIILFMYIRNLETAVTKKIKFSKTKIF